MIRKSKRFTRPKKAYEKSRIEEENVLAAKYGLKNKREIWKTAAKVNYFRRRAKALAKSPANEQQILFDKLQAIGLQTSSISDVLALSTEDLLKRRLSTVVASKSLANTIKHARQLIVHKKVLINGKAINVPSYLVPISDESSISIRGSKKPVNKEVKQEKVEGESQ